MNITLILGIAALIAPVVVRSTVVRREAPLAVGATVLFAVAVWLGPGRIAGAALGLLGLVALAMLGSNLFNSLFGGAIVGLAAPAGGRGGMGLPIVVAMVLVTLLAWAVLFRGLRVSRPEALVLLVAYLCTLPLLV